MPSLPTRPIPARTHESGGNYHGNHGGSTRAFLRVWNGIRAGSTPTRTPRVSRGWGGESGPAAGPGKSSRISAEKPACILGWGKRVATRGTIPDPRRGIAYKPLEERRAQGIPPGVPALAVRAPVKQSTRHAGVCKGAEVFFTWEDCERVGNRGSKIIPGQCEHLTSACRLRIIPCSTGGRHAPFTE